jgi:hypothetical protein
MPEFFRKHDCRRDDWSRQRTAPGFIDARHARNPALVQRAFVPEAALHRGRSVDD